MEEVDKILILTLNHLGCDIDEAVKSVGDFGISEVVNGVVRCIRTIDSDCDLPASLPQNMAQRFRVAASIAQAVKDVGYPGDVGYQSLLYPNEADLRKIFMFLIEKLPKDTAAVSDEPFNKAALIHQEAKRKLCEAVAQPWIPPHCRHVLHSYATHASVTEHGVYHTRQFTSKPYTGLESLSKVSSGLRSCYKDYFRRVTKTVDCSYVIATLLNSHAIQLQRGKCLPPCKTEQKIFSEGNSEAFKLELLNKKEDVKPHTTCMSLSGQSALSSFETAKHMMDVKDTEREISASMSSSEPEAGVITEEHLTMKREEQLLKLQMEVSSVIKEIEECSQAVQDAKSTLNKV
ncbi:coiled-coil domain-containing protein 22-like isoform X1 [Panulirus ornatus]|uniref:coiled-coil domain-containing protein 22-like isoform X1 n=2 Tax=Panulirus ornatus TaxID=150431 RepID=UPI003A8788E1